MNGHVESAAEQLIGPDRMERPSQRALGCRSQFFPAGQFGRYAA